MPITPPANFCIHIGAQGAQGVVGAQGAQGVIGVQGDTH